VRLFALHSVFGHTAAGLASLARALRPRASFAWIHDYATICESANLLRNDVASCSAPETSSMACRVCVYGDTRQQHLAALHTLFEAVPFHIVAPSCTALATWQRGSRLLYLNAFVHANCGIQEDPATRTMRGTSTDPVNVAFVGHPVPQKGWPLFQELVNRTRAQGAYRFFHFVSETSVPRTEGLAQVAVRVTAQNRLGMVAALMAHRIDLVAVLSPWPETFSYVVHEAFAAGASVVALQQSGNVVAAIHRYGRGIVLRDDTAVLDFFIGGGAVEHARGRTTAEAKLLTYGTTATVDLSTEQPTDPLRLLTSDPDLHVVAGGTAIAPAVSGDTYSFTLPADSGRVYLVSRSTAPAATQVASGDPRRLGIAVGSLSLDGSPVPPDDQRRCSGWHAPELDGSTWTDGRAVLEVGGAQRLEVRLTRRGLYCRSPLAALTG
jgi:hypothetical protein